MLIFCSSFSLASVTQFSDIAGMTADWIQSKTGTRLSPAQLKDGTTWQVADGHRVIAWSTQPGAYPEGFAIDYTHLDQEIRGRRWKTEIGARRSASGLPLEVSVRLISEESSTQVPPPRNATMPGIVHKMLERGSPVPETPGLSIHVLDSRDAVDAFGKIVTSSQRTYPILVVSPCTDTGRPLVNMEHLRFKVEGLAEVVTFDHTLSRAVGAVLGPRIAVWNGGISIIWTIRDRFTPAFFHGRRFLPDDVRLIGGGLDITAEQTLFDEITSQTNWLNERRHISPETVKTMIKSAELSAAIKEAEASGNYKRALDEAKALSAENETQNKAEFTRLSDRIDELKLDYDIAIEEKEKVEAKLASTQDALVAAQIDGGRQKTDCDAATIILRDVAGPQFPPEVALDSIQRLFPDRILLLDSARETARASSHFKYRPELWRTLWLFATDYWSALCLGGQGDAEARKILGSNYGSGESETTSSTKKTARQRTFQYNDHDVQMDAHLRIGSNSSSAVEGLRIHFCWDSEKKFLVVGYCGKHLSTSSGH